MGRRSQAAVADRPYDEQLKLFHDNAERLMTFNQLIINHLASWNNLTIEMSNDTWLNG